MLRQSPMTAACKRARRERFSLGPAAVIMCLLSIRLVVWATSVEGRFTLATGLSWPSTVRVVATGDNHGGFTGDGEFYLLLECDPATIRLWLEDRPFWGGSSWQRGPVPTQIGYHCQLGSQKSLGSVTFPDGSKEYFGGSAEVREVLSSPRLWYAARDRCQSPDLPYHQGNLLIVDPESGRVWYSDWKW